MRFSLVELALFALAAALVVVALPRCAGAGAARRGRRQLDADAGRAQSGRHAGDDRARRSAARLDAHDPAAGLVHQRPEARQACAQYGLRGPPSAYQEDHLISLELGGHPTDPRNLWPEPYPRAATVDRIENELNDAVCSGRLTLAEAQRRESALKHATVQADRCLRLRTS